MKQITKAWLDRALDDLDSIEQLLKKEHLTNVVAFHAQQAVEKSLKAVIEELEIGFVRTHNLLRLHELVKPHYDVTQDTDMLERLDAVYTESRYPNEMGLLPYGKPTIEDARLFYDFAREVYEQIKVELEAIS
jgi:HEPN domain-containing protein